MMNDGRPVRPNVRELADAIQRPGQIDDAATLAVSMRQAVVATTTPALTIYLGGSSTAVPARRLQSYLPSPDQVVMVLQFDGDLLVLGNFA